MTARISKLFGMDIYTDNAEYKGKVFDLVINLEKGRIETITTEPLRVRSKQEAKKIISEKSIPYRTVKSVKDIVITCPSKALEIEEEEAPARQPAPQYRYQRRK
ncbi:MAG: PRC-barrel domain-containing protein [Candidatus Diapherotrites archaeon]|nr:PRC-barrel domain-containing protein [Candidatus Diapherotrites archaeon]